MIFTVRQTETFHRLFPKTGSKIITETSSPEDSPCLERNKLSNRQIHCRAFRRNSQNYRRLSFGRKRRKPAANNPASAIYNDLSGAQDSVSCGETKIPPASQPAEQIKLWATNPRKPTRRSPARNNPKPAAPAPRKAQPWPPSLRPRKSNRPLLAVSPETKTRRNRFLPKTFPVRIFVP